MRAAHALLFSAHRPVGEYNYHDAAPSEERERRVQRITLWRTLEFISTAKTQSKMMIFLYFTTRTQNLSQFVLNWRIKEFKATKVSFFYCWLTKRHL